MNIATAVDGSLPPGIECTAPMILFAVIMHAYRVCRSHCSKVRLITPCCVKAVKTSACSFFVCTLHFQNCTSDI